MSESFPTFRYSLAAIYFGVPIGSAFSCRPQPNGIIPEDRISSQNLAYHVLYMRQACSTSQEEQYVAASLASSTVLQSARVDRLMNQAIGFSDADKCAAHIQANGGTPTPEAIKERQFFLQCLAQIGVMLDVFTQHRSGLLEDELCRRLHRLPNLAT